VRWTRVQASRAVARAVSGWPKRCKQTSCVYTIVGPWTSAERTVRNLLRATVYLTHSRSSLPSGFGTHPAVEPDAHQAALRRRLCAPLWAVVFNHGCRRPW
jgi:hypothetical protein